MMTNTDLKILIVGGGSIGKRHITNLQKIGVKQIIVLKRQYDTNFAEEFSVDVITSFAEADTFTLDIVFICSPTSLHLESLEYGVKRNLHIFMEKPLIHNRSGLSKAKTLLTNYKKVFFIGFMLRYHPLVVQLKEWIDNKIIGEWYNARFEFGSWLPYWHPWEDYRESYASRKELGGGVVNTITHELDLMIHLLGVPNKVVAMVQNLGKLNIEVEEQAEAIFDYNNGLSTIHLDYLQKDYDRFVKILADKGKITWDWHQNTLNLKKHNCQSEIIELKKDFDINQLYIDEINDFLSLIQNKKLNHTLDGTYAVENTHWMLKIHEVSDFINK